MTSQHDFQSFPFTSVALFEVTDPSCQSEALADLVVSLGERCIFAFDRLLWSYLSSGQMPAQLFPFNSFSGCEYPQPKENYLAIFYTGELPKRLTACEFLNGRTVTVDKVQMAGTIGPSYEEEEDFMGGFYSMLLEWESEPQTSLPEIAGAKTFLFTEGKHTLQLFVGHELSSSEDYREQLLADTSLSLPQYGSYLYFPPQEVVTELAERVCDKEKIHLDEQIRGVHC